MDKVQSSEKNNDSYTYVFILSLVDISASLPFEIIPEHFLSRAEPGQIKIFKERLNMARPVPINYFLYERSQVRQMPGEREGQIVYLTDELPSDKWKYWIVSHNGTNHGIQNLQEASLLLKEEIELGFQIFSMAGISGGSLASPAMVSYLSEAEEFSSSRSTKQITVDDLNNIRIYHSLIKGLNAEYGVVKNAVKLFDDLRALPRHSDFRIIGLFSIIESLISHSPKLEFFHDSIKHQIRTKIPLLAKRFVRELNYGEFFNEGAREDKVLSCLYDYRSRIVHAGNSDIPTELSGVLKGKNEVRGFLKELTKLLLITALKEPELVTDLKSC